MQQKKTQPVNIHFKQYYGLQIADCLNLFFSFPFSNTISMTTDTNHLLLNTTATNRYYTLAAMAIFEIAVKILNFCLMNLIRSESNWWGFSWLSVFVCHMEQKCNEKTANAHSSDLTHLFLFYFSFFVRNIFHYIISNQFLSCTWRVMQQSFFEIIFNRIEIPISDGIFFFSIKRNEKTPTNTHIFLF